MIHTKKPSIGRSQWLADDKNKNRETEMFAPVAWFKERQKPNSNQESPSQKKATTKTGEKTPSSQITAIGTSVQ